MAEVSIDDVAEAAGVHRSTVSRAFSRPDAVRESTKEHVLRVAAELGYSMNSLAQALRRGSSNLVPLIVPDITNPFFAELARATTTAAERRGFQLLLCITGGDTAQTAGYFTTMRSMYSPFAVVAPSTRVDLETLRQHTFDNRVVVIDRVDHDPSLPTVTVDSALGVDLAVDHLLGLGHTRIAYAPGIGGTHTAQDRWDAYHRAAGRHGFAPVVLEAAAGSDLGPGIVDHWMQETQLPTAVIASNDVIAFAVISELGARGFAVPQDVSVIGFDGLDLGADFNPRLTSVRQPIGELGRIAIELGETLIADGPPAHVILEPTLLVRSSTQKVQ
jgi:DNA-binding LacI/PurR family transcriptional regulator